MASLQYQSLSTDVFLETFFTLVHSKKHVLHHNSNTYILLLPHKHTHRKILSNSKYTCLPMFIAAPFTIGKTWKQSKCPSSNEWLEKMWYTYTVEYYEVIQRME